MSDLVVSNDPIGTRDAVIKHGINPNDAGSCSRPDGPGGNRGCAFYNDCVFARDGYGSAPNCTAFRDQGPQNILYFASIPLGRGGRSEKEDFMPCFNWMGSVKARADAGDRTGEIFEIIGREGDTFTRIEKLAVKPTPDAKDLRIETKAVHDCVVPKFKRLGESSVDNAVVNVREEILKGRAERLKRQREANAGLTPSEPEVAEAEPAVTKRRFKYGNP